MKHNLKYYIVALSITTMLTALAMEPTRSLPAPTTTGVVFGRTAFVQPQATQSAVMWMGISTDVSGGSDTDKDVKCPYTIASVAFDSTNSLKVTGVLAKTGTINGSTITGWSNIPFAGKVIDNLIMMQDTYPVVTAGTDGQFAVYMDNTAPTQQILRTEPSAIGDANGDEITKAIRAIAASPTYIFATVSQKDKEFRHDTVIDDGVYRGIAVIKKAVDNSKLDVLAADDFSQTGANAKAAQLILIGLPVAIIEAVVDPIGSAMVLSNTVAMHYSSTIDRVYIGLSNVTRDDDNKEGGFLSLVKGRVGVDGDSKTKLFLEPIVVDATKALFYDATHAKNVTNRIIGFYGDTDGTDLRMSSSHICTMHTSTGKDYVIVHAVSKLGLVVSDDNVYALAVAPKDPSGNGIEKDPTQVGTLVKVDQTTGIPVWSAAAGYAAPETYVDMPTYDQPATQVGIGLITEAIIDGTWIQDMKVEGDTVYIALAGNTKINAGIYASTALFEPLNGFIRAWTPWQRVMGDMRRVKGMGVNTLDGTFTILTTQLRSDLTSLNTYNTARVTSWGRSDTVTAQDGTVEADATLINNLSPVLEQLFPQSQGGVLRLRSFDEFTPGFTIGQFSMMVALGTNKVALIQTGQYVGGALTPVTNFITSGAGQNVFVKDATTDAVLGTIAPLTHVEVSRSTHANQGWLFVAGCGGLAVLSFTAGAGFNNLTTLSAAGFPGAAGWSFKLLTPSTAGNSFNRTRKLAAANGSLYVMTFSNVYKLIMSAGKFDGTPSIVLGESVAVNPPNNVTTFNFNDMVVPANQRAIFATTAGLAWANVSGAATRATLVAGFNNDEIARLQYLSQDRTQTTTTGNMCVLLQDLIEEGDQAYRFDVDASAAASIKCIDGKDADGTNVSFIDFNRARSGINTDGTILYSTRSEDFGETAYLDAHRISDDTVTDLTDSLEADTDVNVLVDGLMRDGTAGTQELPADWGVRVNQ